MNVRARAFCLAVLTAALAGCVVASVRRPLPPEPGAAPTAAFGRPLAAFTVLSPFGERGHRFHTGIDLRGRRGGGDPVFASRSGTVVRSETRTGYGRLVEIQHADGYSTRYAHLRRIEVHKGQKVEQGEEIGTVGDSGRATTPHLHFEILTPAYRFTDPAPFLTGARKHP